MVVPPQDSAVRRPDTRWLGTVAVWRPKDGEDSDKESKNFGEDGEVISCGDSAR